MVGSILIVDDDARVRRSLAQALAQGEAEVRTAADGEAALAAVAEQRPDVVLADVRMPGITGLDLLRLLKERAPDIDVVMMTAFDDLQAVSTAMRDGALDFLVKPVDLHQLRRLMERVLEDQSARRPGASASRLAAELAERDRAPADPPLVGRDARMVSIFKVIGQVATSRASVIIRGESGTGKELIARAIHRSSPAAGGPFVPVNCTALPSTLLESELFGHVRGAFTGATGDRKGRFALAGRGTIFLDEIGDTTIEFQAKLLRVLQEREYYPVGAEQPQPAEARVIAATHRDLEAMVAAGDFRADLYYRLRVVEISLPPLRERPNDVPLLAEHFVGKAASDADRKPPILSAQALDVLLAHSWPGNVRELENALTRAVLLTSGDVIHPRHLALAGPAGPTSDPGLITLEAMEGHHTRRVLEATGWHKTRSAEMLGISRPRLDRLIEKHGLNRAPAAPGAAAEQPKDAQPEAGAEP